MDLISLTCAPMTRDDWGCAIFGIIVVVFVFWFCFIRKQDWDGGDCW
jgi:preprotein translocase subunit YajC